MRMPLPSYAADVTKILFENRLNPLLYHLTRLLTVKCRKRSAARALAKARAQNHTRLYARDEISVGA